VIEIDIFYVVNDVFRRYFEPLEKDRYVQVLDDHDVHRWGNRFAHVEPRYEVVLPFQTILPGWKVRIAPQEAEALARREERRGLIDVILIGVSAIALFVGLGVMVIAVRAERRSNELKSEFIANVSHELKTPLSLIRMFGELLATGRTKGPEQEREYAEIITRESERLSRLIDNVLDFARIERGRVAYEFKLGDLAEVLSRGLDVYKWRLDREGMKLSVEMEHDLPPVRIDENALTLVLLNLVDNAVKYASEGKELRVSVKRQGDRVNLVVADRGPGIPQDERERVFERFYRSRNVRGRPVRGSGIGLSLVKHIAEAHGGGVELDSRLGEGSTFTVWLPVAPPEPDVGLIEGTEDELRSQEDPDHRGRAGHRARTS
jgi:two-component system phosphate regulon sensor histidine kinase PhoR